MVHLAVPTSVHFHYAHGFDTQTLAQMLDSLVRVSRRVVCNHYASIQANAVLSPGRPYYTPSYNTPRRVLHSRGLYPATRADAGLPCRVNRPEGRLNYRGKSGDKSFPFNNFTCFLTLFPKCFSSFDHSTCALSVSGQYLALEEIYLPLRAAFPNNSTRRRSFTWPRTPEPKRGSHPL